MPTDKAQVECKPEILNLLDFDRQVPRPAKVG